MNRIAELRKEKNISQISLGMKLNVSQKMISAYENEKNEPSIDLLMKMGDIFHASIDYIVGYSDTRYPEFYLERDLCTQHSKKSVMKIYDELSKKNQWITHGVMLGLLAGQAETVDSETFNTKTLPESDELSEHR